MASFRAKHFQLHPAFWCSRASVLKKPVCKLCRLEVPCGLFPGRLGVGVTSRGAECRAPSVCPSVSKGGDRQEVAHSAHVQAVTSGQVPHGSAPSLGLSRGPRCGERLGTLLRPHAARSRGRGANTSPLGIQLGLVRVSSGNRLFPLGVGSPRAGEVPGRHSRPPRPNRRWIASHLFWQNACPVETPGKYVTGFLLM